MELETVKIVSDKHERGYVIINKSDYDSKLHKLYGVDKIAEKPDKPDELPDTPKRTYTKRT